MLPCLSQAVFLTFRALSAALRSVFDPRNFSSWPVTFLIRLDSPSSVMDESSLVDGMLMGSI